MTTFAKSLFLIKYAIYMPPNTKDLAINQTMVAYGNPQNATAHARANNSDLLQSLKHLMKTRLQWYAISSNFIFLPVCKYAKLSILTGTHTVPVSCATDLPSTCSLCHKLHMTSSTCYQLCLSEAIHITCYLYYKLSMSKPVSVRSYKATHITKSMCVFSSLLLVTNTCNVIQALQRFFGNIFGS